MNSGVINPEFKKKNVLLKRYFIMIFFLSGFLFQKYSLLTESLFQKHLYRLILVFFKNVGVEEENIEVQEEIALFF